MSGKECDFTILRKMVNARFVCTRRQRSHPLQRHKKSTPDISPKVLTETLKNLENDGLIVRRLYPEIPPRVEYSLSPLGVSLMPHISGLVGWAIEHFDEIIGNKK